MDNFHWTFVLTFERRCRLFECSQVLLSSRKTVLNFRKEILKKELLKLIPYLRRLASVSSRQGDASTGHYSLDTIHCDNQQR